MEDKLGDDGDRAGAEDGDAWRSVAVHDLNGLIGVILMAADELEATASGDDVTELVKEIQYAAGRAGALTATLGSSGASAADPGRVDLRSLVSELRPALARLCGERIELETDVPDGPFVVSARAAIERAIFNLVKNSVESLAGPGAIELGLSTRFFDAAVPRAEAGLYAEVLPPPASGEYVVLSVSDDGAGMPIHLPRRALERRFSTKGPAEDGRGLGLASVREAVDDAGGGLVLSSTPGVGTRFDLYFEVASTVT